MDLEGLNLREICRTCKCISPNMRSLFEGYENMPQTPRIDEMLMACASVRITFGDGLPSNICHLCVEQLRSAFVFKLQCENIDASLREFTKKIQVKIKEELSDSDVMESPNTLNKFLNKQSTKNNIEENPLEPVAPGTKTDNIELMDNNQMHMTCHKCSKIFTTLEGHRCHKRICTDKIYKCKQCNKEYRTLYNFQRHEQTHDRKKVYVCRICNKILTELANLKRHLVIHLKKKPFSCKTCNRGFNRLEYLHHHAPSCIGNAGYPCDICGKTFDGEDSLEVHKKKHANQQSKLQTIENMDNIEDHYYQIDQNDDVIFSDHSDPDIDNYFEPEAEVTESQDTNKIKEEADISYHDDDSIVSEEIAAVDCNNDIDSSLNKDNESIENRGRTEAMEKEETIKEVKVEENKIDLHQFGYDNILDLNDDHSGGDSTCSGYSLKEALVSEKVEKVIGTPRKNSSNLSKSLKMKAPCRTKRHLQKNIKKEEPDEEYGELSSPACQEIFNTMQRLEKNARQTHKGITKHKCPTCNKEFNTVNHLRRHVTSHSSIKLFQCTICTKNFNRRDHLKRHQRVHETQNDFECEICQGSFNKAHHLANHKASEHGIEKKQIECPLCQKCFKTEKSRDVHMNEHNEEKKYQCAKCEKKFFSKSRLTGHMRFHNQHSKKFLCSECGQRFSRNDYLIIHMRRHTGEKPFKCKYCGKGFPRSTDLTVHERYHTGEKTCLCTICGRGFVRPCDLTAHMRVHTGEKPYQCTYCDAAFAQSSDLKGHVRRHTGERLHCELCPESFILGHLLNLHKRNVHGITKLKRPQTSQIQENPEDSPIAISEQKPVVP